MAVISMHGNAPRTISIDDGVNGVAWTEVHYLDQGNNLSLLVAELTATSDDDAPATCTVTLGEDTSRMSAYVVPFSDVGEITVASQAQVTRAPNPPVATPAGGDGSYRVYAGWAQRSTGELLAWPSGYTEACNLDNALGALRFGEADLEGSSFDPGAGSIGGSFDNYILAFTIAMAVT